ncbi:MULTISPECIES: GMC family oxidoreductase N-terminal domain-containing protein [unclassified Mesorhizobium]|uniref:GMC family oxidoreductase n=1 Tax=unclassified Mesorhizobium TaxID=325217 RepID=UPI0009639729|nr:MULTISPECIES: GMC family oxidoreductase N-terminal domain-containing protein [unclassified Mesorhizobium]MBN9255731.1 GMC family oxidoreductase N-terminal domain-containing protein [Mesorhizobium sp.]MBN9271966.1 GMC family oxidoreductase N-terminal domain-containing protein [Mesorhizobium sp.]OJX84233.1 MAG: GMC oxidoreductase [Mesorhizobium sp. 65-26]
MTSKIDTSAETYDYVVIGAGSAGCVVAGRLSDAGYSVLLLEAGGRDTNPWIHIPLGYARLYANPALNWCFTSEPEPGLNGRRLFQPRGKVLGGTGSINGMIYMRGQREDFDAWAAAGCSGWGFDDVLPYYKKSEDQQRGASAYHGVGGPLSVSDVSGFELGDAFIAAAANLGAPRNDDFNGPSQIGAGYVQVTTRKGRRWSTAAGYLKGQKSLRIVTRALVSRLRIEGSAVTGVDYSVDGEPRLANARAEVVLCAGAYGSPQLLELSGIGAGEHLRRIGIDVRHELPGVGEDLRDHFGVGLECRCTKPLTVNDLYNNPLRGGLALARYFFHRSGLMATNGNYANDFIVSGLAQTRPDMMVTFMAWCTDEQLKPRPFPGFTILAEHMRPDATGSVHATAPDIRTQPAIRFNFLESEADCRAAIAGLRHARRLSMTQPMAGYVANEITPGRDKESDKALLEYCRANGLSLLHPVGGCRMGVDDRAVVDPRLRLRGLAGLRIADASIMPGHVTANTHAPTVMIGERAADMILEDSRR